VTKILHIGACGAIMNPFVDFVKNNFDFNLHEFLLTSTKPEPELASYKNVRLAPRKISARLMHLIVAVIKMHQSKKVIIHGLFDIKLVYILFMMPWLLKKCYWVMWGGDLYIYQLAERDWKWKVREFFRRPVIKNMGYFTTTVPGDYLLAKEWYGTNAKWIHNLMYPSHLHRSSDEVSCKKKKNDTVLIQIGNSADPMNNHFEIIDKLEKYKKNNIEVYCPLSYGSDEHKNNVISYGAKKLGKKFVPMIEFMSFSDYNSHMACIDIAIFNHDRQQGMGNIIGLLSLGKKIIMKRSVTPFSFFSEIGLHVYSMDDENMLEKLEENIAIENISKMQSYFNKERLKLNWDEIFYGR
jgi:hypothetical protein